MPNVTFFIRADQMPSTEALTGLTEQCSELCTNVLKAALDKVHIIYLATLPGRGLPVFVEVKYRLKEFRSPDVIDAFMAALDNSIMANTGLTARIRCFGYAPPHILARN